MNLSFLLLRSVLVDHVYIDINIGSCREEIRLKYLLPSIQYIHIPIFPHALPSNHSFYSLTPSHHHIIVTLY